MANEMVFQNRAANYSHGRPSYAPEAIDYILHRLAVKDLPVADVGSGTGILTKELVSAGFFTYAVEPNADMRGKAEKALGGCENFRSVSAAAENTTLADSSVGLVTAASAFHWFNAAAFRRECRRILVSGGTVCLMINVRMNDEFTQRQTELCRRYCRGFTSLTHGYEKTLQRAADFFAGEYSLLRFDFPIPYTKDKFISRTLSSSYSPLPEDEGYDDYVRGLRALVDGAFSCDEFTVKNETVMFVGKVS